MNTHWKRNRLLSRPNWAFHVRAPLKKTSLVLMVSDFLTIAKTPFDNTLMTLISQLDYIVFF